MIHYIIAATFLIILAIIRISHYYRIKMLKNRIIQIENKLKTINIVYSHYSELLMAYAEFSKWLNEVSKDKLSKSDSDIHLCKIKFNETFKNVKE